ncbi:N-acetyl-D-Glu racemase DgcA [Phenylobacterium sp.]|uniref:N-acetyl-D-Glu racemase DgcA n=1 Tax=Phenylobacterium sp. TaxID=1871053 RepID=UPI0028111DA2|nr:N-acetyl-D-Glu racemase DgcA [Phenylobacterium sp.]
MALTLSVRFDRLPLRAPFRISRGVKTHAEVVVVELSDGEFTGRGECVPYARYDETPGKVMAALRGDPEVLLDALPPGAARNALDCAYWDLLAKREGEAVFDMLGRMPPQPVASAVTISLDAPGGMAEAAAAVADAPLLKVKLSADRPAERLLAVAEAAPQARLIVDPNEGWTPEILKAMADPVARCNVVLVEQPLPAGQDAALEGLRYPAPICADESIHTRHDLDAVAGRYQAINVKLDKAGGLTEAVALADAARARGLSLMAGCMVASSLAIAPALVFAADADFVDLDGPWWIAKDRPGGCRFERGVLHPPQPGFWGDPAATP